MIIPMMYYYYIVITIISILGIRIVLNTNLVLILIRSYQSFTDRFQLYQLYKVPQYNNTNNNSPQFQENRLYRHVTTYLNSLILSSDDSDLTNLLSGSTSNDVVFRLDSCQSVNDTFLGAKLRWTTNQIGDTTSSSSSSFLLLRIRRSDKKRIFRQYFQHILTVADEIDQRNKEIKLHVNIVGAGDRGWRSVPFTHPASFESLVIVDSDLKSKVKSDLELFLKSKQYYHRLGRVWNRSYLLYGGGCGAGKTGFIAAMAKLLSYDVYDLDFARISDSSDLKALLLQTSPRSVIVVEDIDRLLPRMPSLVDGIFSCLGEERVLVFTANSQDKERAFGFDRSAAMMPGLVDVHVHFPLCDNFSSFKTLASSYLGLKEHKLFPQLEEIFKSGGSGFLSPDEIGDIMMSNRTSPTRALKSVISALHQSSGVGSGSGSGRSGDESGEPSGSVFSRESTMQTVKEFRKLYGLLKMGSRRKEEPLVDLDSSRHD